MFSNVSNVKPWFRDDIKRVLESIYFSHKSTSRNASNSADNHYQTGFAAAISSVALAVGVNPEQILEPEDIQAIREKIKKGI